MKCIILLEADSDKIISNLFKRDHKTYSEETIKVLITAERTKAQQISKELNIPLIIYKMSFDNNDSQRLLYEINMQK